ncbi:hypothetical protein OIU74_011212 [Salix koriyanagi]|uniref:Uncharacterized protein n=1 Tax=Salix koriyanagi TaxID=2511006 RepID=A0A9Q0YTZ1_9ROSI|nr:hypothetical protein OIU74_011212 [Salix koriyanagi]
MAVCLDRVFRLLRFFLLVALWWFSTERSVKTKAKK